VMGVEYGVRLQIEPKMFKDWQNYTQWIPGTDKVGGGIDTLKSLSSMAFQSLASKITDEMPNGVDVEIRVKGTVIG